MASAKDKQDYLYQPDTPIIYKLWKGLQVDDSTVKENLIIINPAVGNTAINLNQNTDISFHFSDATKFLNLASNQSGFIVNIRFKTQHKPAGARGVFSCPLAYRKWRVFVSGKCGWDSCWLHRCHRLTRKENPC